MLMKELANQVSCSGERLEVVLQKGWQWNKIKIEGGLVHSFIVSKYCLYILTQTLTLCHVTMIGDKREIHYRLPIIAYL